MTGRDDAAAAMALAAEAARIAAALGGDDPWAPYEGLDEDDEAEAEQSRQARLEFRRRERFRP